MVSPPYLHVRKLSTRHRKWSPRRERSEALCLLLLGPGVCFEVHPRAPRCTPRVPLTTSQAPGSLTGLAEDYPCRVWVGMLESKGLQKLIGLTCMKQYVHGICCDVRHSHARGFDRQVVQVHGSFRKHVHQRAYPLAFAYGVHGNIEAPVLCGGGILPPYRLGLPYS